jgi:hypothetical protein
VPKSNKKWEPEEEDRLSDQLKGLKEAGKMLEGETLTKLEEEAGRTLLAMRRRSKKVGNTAMSNLLSELTPAPKARTTPTSAGKVQAGTL